MDEKLRELCCFLTFIASVRFLRTVVPQVLVVLVKLY